MKQINERWYLGSDSMQFILYEKSISKKGAKKGGDVYMPKAYCGNLNQLKSWLLNQEIRENLELLENIDKCIELSNTIDKALGGME